MLLAMKRKSTVRMTMNVTGDLAAELKRLQKKLDSSMSRMMRRALNYWVAAGCPDDPEADLKADS
jgi:predicted transcriptional regulator